MGPGRHSGTGTRAGGTRAAAHGRVAGVFGGRHLRRGARAAGRTRACGTRSTGFSRVALCTSCRCVAAPSGRSSWCGLVWTMQYRLRMRTARSGGTRHAERPPPPTICGTTAGQCWDTNGLRAADAFWPYHPGVWVGYDRQSCCGAGQGGTHIACMMIRHTRLLTPHHHWVMSPLPYPPPPPPRPLSSLYTTYFSPSLNSEPTPSCYTTYCLYWP